MAQFGITPLVEWSSPLSVVLTNPKTRVEGDFSALCEQLSSHVWLSTSGGGSSGPKWVGLSKTALLASAQAVNAHLQSQESDIWLKALPTFHVGGLSIYARAHLTGAKVVDSSNEKWNAQEFVRKVEEYRISLTSLVPTQIFDLVEANRNCPPSLRAVVVGGGALGESLYKRAVALKWPLLSSYGMSECSSQVATAPLSSCGKAEMAAPEKLGHVEWRLNSDGRIELKSEALLTCYARWTGADWAFWDPKDAMGWFKSEDLGQIVGQRILNLERSGEVFKILGELVSVARLEGMLIETLSQQFAGLDVTLMDRPDERKGHDLVLVVAGGSANVAQALLEDFNQRVRPFERASQFVLVDQIPRSPLGKVEKLRLRSILEHSF